MKHPISSDIMENYENFDSLKSNYLAVGVVNADTIILVDFKRDEDVSSYDMSFLGKSLRPSESITAEWKSAVNQ